MRFLTTPPCFQTENADNARAGRNVALPSIFPCFTVDHPRRSGPPCFKPLKSMPYRNQITEA